MRLGDIVGGAARVGGNLRAVRGLDAVVMPSNRYKVVCWRWARNAKGILERRIAWEDEIDNLVVTEGRNHLLSVAFKGGTQITSWYVGLTGGSPTVAAGDTLASHGGWTEATPYSGNRPALTLGSVSGGSVDNSASKASYSINATATVGGAFIASAASGTTGTLYGAGAFTTGNRSVLSGDTLDVTATLSVTSS
jgi:hypothetical protein